MRTRLWLNLLLLLVIAGLAAFVWLNPGKDKQADQTVSTLKAEQVTRIEIRRHVEGSDDKVIRMQRQDNGSWLMTEPQSALINNSRVRQMLNLLKDPVQQRFDAAGKQLADFDLDPGKLSVTYNDQTLVFGMMNPMNYQRYLLRGSDILLVNETAFTTLNGDAVSFFTPRLLPEGLELSKVDLPAAYEANGKTLQQWQNLNAMYVAAWNRELEPSQGSIRLYTQDNEPLVFELISDEPELWIGNAKLDAKYQIANSEKADLLPMPVSDATEADVPEVGME